MKIRGNAGWGSVFTGIVALGLLSACGGGSGGSGGGVIDPSDSNSVADALRVKLGDVDASQVSGDPPQQDPQAAGNPVVDVSDGQDTAVTPGESKDISVDTSTSGDSLLSVLYAKVAGADSYFEAQAAQTQSLRTKQDGTTVVTFDIPQNLGSGEFCVELSIGDSESRVSNVEAFCFTSTPEDGSAAATLDGLQGRWARCVDGRSELVIIDGDVADFSETSYANANCTGEVVGTFSDTLRLTVGPQLTTDSGLTANELDVEIIDSPDPDDIGLVEYDIIRVAGDQFFAGEGEASSPENRPTALDLDSPYVRSEEVAPPDPVDEFSPAAVRSRLQGAWELCVDDRFLERATFDGNVLFFEETEYTGSGCSGDIVRVTNDTLSYEIGPSFEDEDGDLINPFDAEITSADNPQDVGLQFFGIVRVSAGPDELQLNVGDEGGSPGARPSGFPGPPYLRP
ncbi:hypothetical protein [Algiphilus sp.]|uniref:hypothetical protein n=1 Tax=Algiphilus sp. TaxID=1872431 RepID=UPI003C46CC30